MMTIWQQSFLDPLYGRVRFDDDLAALARTPVVQRLRHVRLSNIDSLDMPAIANLSRFEHVIGVAYLAGEVGFRGGMTPFDLLVLKSSALIHDWAITSFGHLVEEALQYVGTRFDHEQRLREIISGEASEEIGGIDLQILAGRETGLRAWARRVAGAQASKLLAEMMEHVHGGGRRGRVVAGDIDLDNIDNVFRMAFHMGLPMERETPLRLARAMVGVTKERGEPVFRASAEQDILSWKKIRRDVYQNLMLAERDFVGKVMMLSATVGAFTAGEICKADWSLVDHQLIMRLLGSATPEVRNTAERWTAGELWDLTPLRWMSGQRPDYPSLMDFSRVLTVALDRPCFAYGIKDKRDRRLIITFDDGSRREYGEDASQWLLGVGSSKKKNFTGDEIEKVFDLAGSTFSSQVISDAQRPGAKEAQACLF
jgi:uncharacterized protein